MRPRRVRRNGMRCALSRTAARWRHQTEWSARPLWPRAHRRKYPRAKITKIKAAFDPHGILHLDGGEILFSRKAPLAEFYAHEATHAIDGTDHAISGTEG